MRQKRPHGGGAAAAALGSGNNAGADDIAEARVYVNNMNTPHATVTLPERGGAGGRTAAGRFGREKGAGDGEAFTGARSGPGLRRGGSIAAAAAAATTVNYSNHSTGKVYSKQVTGGTIGKAKDVDPLSPGSEHTRKTVVDVDDDTLHPNLEHVYSRVMRRLQRELNYEELNRASLADQFGVALDLEEEEERDEAGQPNATQFNSSGFSHSGHDSALGTGSVATPAALGSPPQQHLANTASINAAPSMIIRYGRRQNAHGIREGRVMASDANHYSANGTRAHSAPGNADTDDVELAFAVQPCPRTLRLVVQHVEETLSNKLAMAERGSVKDCLRLVFESRALLDRLLKEAPTYTSFPRDPEELPKVSSLPADGDRSRRQSTVRPGRGGHHHHLQNMFQEFRQKPVLLPRATYTQDAVTGAIGVALDLAQETALGLHHALPGPNNSSLRGNSSFNGQAVDAGSGPVGKTKMRPTTAAPNTLQQQQGSGGGDAHASASVPSATSSFMCETSTSDSSSSPVTPAAGNPAVGSPTSVVGHRMNATSDVARSVRHTPELSVLPGLGDGLSGVVLPASYGKTSRRKPTESPAAVIAIAHEMQSSNHISNSGIFLAGNQSDSGGNGATLRSSSGIEGSINHTLKTSQTHHHHHSNTHNNYISGNGAAAPQPPCSLTAAVSKVNVGTLTEDNASNTITDEMYAAVQQYAADLEVQLAEARSTHDGLTAKLLEEESYVDSRQRVIQYLRETLVRECNMLRSQLNFAARREQHLQQTLKETQQTAIAIGNGGNNTHKDGAETAMTGSGVSRSMAASTVGLGHGRLGSVPRQSASGGMGSPSRASLSVAGGDGWGANGREEVSCSSLSAAMGSPAIGGGLHGRHGTPPTSAIPGGRAASFTRGIRGSPAAGDLQNNNTTNEHSELSVGSGNGTAGNVRKGTNTATLTASASNDVTSIQSLLDLVLLAVENDEIFPMGLEAARALGPEGARQAMSKDVKRQADALRATFEAKSKRLQDSITAQRVRNNYVMIEKNKEIDRLQKMADLSYVRNTLEEAVHDLKTSQRRLKSQIQERLQMFQVLMNTTVGGVLNRTKLMDQTIDDNTALQTTQEAMKDMIESTYSLVSPMLTVEYARSGYHPWPLKLRNSTDPLASVIQSRYGPNQVVTLRESLTMLSELYLAVHKYVVQHTVYPEAARPMTGEPLRILCARLALNPLSNTDVIFEVRQRYDREMRLQRAIAKLNFRLLWNVYLQRAITERSVSALATAGMDPYTSTLPVGKKVNELAAQRGALTHERNNLIKERVDNAKQVYRLWREKGIDIAEGFSAPAAGGDARLSILTESRAAAGSLSIVVPAPPPVFGSGLSRSTSVVSRSTGAFGGAGRGNGEMNGAIPSAGSLPGPHHHGSPFLSLAAASTSASGLSGLGFHNAMSRSDGGRSSMTPRSSQAAAHQAQSYLGGMVAAPMTGRL